MSLEKYGVGVFEYAKTSDGVRRRMGVATLATNPQHIEIRYGLGHFAHVDGSDALVILKEDAKRLAELLVEVADGRD